MQLNDLLDAIQARAGEARRICPDCSGTGTLGRAPDGRYYACELCGGHEDSAGSGYVECETDVPALIAALRLAMKRHHKAMNNAMEYGYLDREFGTQNLTDYDAEIAAILEAK